MNLNKALGRVATTLVAGAMLTALALPVYATDGVQGSTETTINSLTITKELQMPTNVVTSENVDFDFTLSGENAGEGETILSNNVSLDVTSGTGTATGTAHFNAGAKNGDTATATFSFSSNFSFSNPGVYKYKINEDDVSADTGYSDATNALYAYLFVKKADNPAADTIGDSKDGMVIYAAVVTTNSTTANKAGAKTETWTNNYMTDATGSLKVTKNIDGTMASPNDEFTFTVSGLTPNRTYVVSGTGITAGSNDKITANAKGEYQFTLKATETRTILGLTANEYVVTETPSTEGYELTSVTGKDDDDEDISDGSADVTLTTEAMTKEVVFVNTRNAVTPTGIVMNVAPYVLLVVVAAAGCFVFLRKRRED